MIARAAVVALLLAAVSVVWSPPAAADGCPPGQELTWVVGPDGVGGMQCVETEDPGNSDNPDDPGNPGPIDNGPVKEYYHTPACAVNGPPPGDPNALCGAAVNSPLCADNEIRMRIYFRWVDRFSGEPVPGDDGYWRNAGSECSGPDDPGPGLQEPEITVEMVMDAARTTAPTAEVSMEPDGESYVNVPNNFYVDSEPVADTLTVLGLPIPVTYTPAEHTWSFGDGANGSGAGIDNAALGQSGAVEHAYSGRGEYDVSVTTTYTVTFTIPGLGEVTPDGTITGTSDPYAVTIEEIGSVVTGVG